MPAVKKAITIISIRKKKDDNKWEIRFYKTVLILIILLIIDISFEEISIYNPVLTYLATVIKEIFFILLNPSTSC
jgi:hypothetical protein